MHAVVFDIDGTLLRSSEQDDRLYRESICAVLGAVRFRPQLSDYTHVSDSGILAQVFDDNGVGADPAGQDAIRDEFLRRTRAHIARHGPFEELPGASKLLNRLKKKPGYRVAIATGGWRSTAQLKLRSAGFDLDGVPLATSDDAIDRVGIMRVALSQLGPPGGRATYYGDGRWDEAACRELGWQFRAVGAVLGGIETFEREYTE